MALTSSTKLKWSGCVWCVAPLSSLSVTAHWARVMRQLARQMSIYSVARVLPCTGGNWVNTNQNRAHISIIDTEFYLGGAEPDLEAQHQEAEERQEERGEHLGQEPGGQQGQAGDQEQGGEQEAGVVTCQSPQANSALRVSMGG